MFLLPDKPQERAARLAARGVDADSLIKVKMNAVWTELCQWRKNGMQYASALECWGWACKSRGPARAPRQAFRASGAQAEQGGP